MIFLDPYFGVPRIDFNSHDGQVFVVLATMNPIEQEGVYPLSEAQLDRFAFLVVLDYPSHESLDAIGTHAFDDNLQEVDPRHNPANHVKTLYFFARLRRLMFGPEVLARWLGADNAHIRNQLTDMIEFSHARPSRNDEMPGGNAPLPEPVDGSAKASRVEEVLGRWLRRRDRNGATVPREAADPLQDYAADWVVRMKSGSYPEVISGASPRGLLKLIRAGHAQALMDGHFDPDQPDQLAPIWDDFDAVASDVLRHRIRLSATSNAMGLRTSKVITELRKWVATRPRLTD